MTTQPPTPPPETPPQWGEPGFQGSPRRKLTTRAWIIITIAIVGAAVAVAAMVVGSNSSAGSSDAAGDVDKVRLNLAGVGPREGFVQVTNHGKATVDYAIELRILSATGVNLGTAYAHAGNVEPGQTARAGFVVSDGSADRVEVVRVRRTAA